ncbi:MAG: 3'-5'-exoribonuclease, partial [Candelina submexicana]
LKTGLTPSASGSAYLELDPPSTNNGPLTSLIAPTSALKLTCAVHGPRPLPRSAPFTPHILLSTHVKFAPFAARQRRGYIRDASERDLAVHLETALRGVIIGDRWPKSGVEVVITVLEGEEDRWWGEEAGGGTTGLGGVGGWGMMTVLAGCITVASAAIADAGIDCVDLVSGGVAAIVSTPGQTSKGRQGLGPGLGKSLSPPTQVVLDPSPAEHEQVMAACVVAHLPFRDEITELWFKGDLPSSSTAEAENPTSPTTMLDRLIDQAVEAASGARTVLEEELREAAEFKFKRNEVNKQAKSHGKGKDTSSDVDMSG